MATKSRPKSSSNNSQTARVERRKLRQNIVRLDLSDELVSRPAVSAGLFSRFDVSRRLTITEVSTLVRKSGFELKGGGGDLETHVELSPAVPWVGGRGWLEAAGSLQSWFATTTIGFYPDAPNQEQGILYIWMDGLTEGDAYVAQIRVGGWPANPQIPGTFHIGASDAAHADVLQSGASQTLSVFIPSVAGPLSLITIRTRGLGGWLFDDVTILHAGNLG
jgi:hypothetical protein